MALDEVARRVAPGRSRRSPRGPGRRGGAPVLGPPLFRAGLLELPRESRSSPRSSPLIGRVSPPRLQLNTIAAMGARATVEERARTWPRSAPAHAALGPRRVGTRPGRATRSGDRAPRTRAGCRSWSRSGTGGCRLAVHLLPRRGGDHGRRPRRTPAPGCGCSSAATPTSPTSAPSRRPTAAGLRHQRLRRDAARAVRVGRQAARRELRPSPADSGLQPHRSARDRDGRGRAPTGARWRFADLGDLDVWYTRLDVEDIGPRGSGREERPPAHSNSERRDKARKGQLEGSFKKLTQIVDGSPSSQRSPPVLSLPT